MWVFGYGSLMWDGWEIKHGCRRRVQADLRGYRRALNKASVRNWGTKAHPGPTLNVIADGEATCRGVAFEFPDAAERAVIADLAEREGGFDLRPLRVTLLDGENVDGITPVYAGKNVIVGKAAAEIAAMAAKAHGTSGSCADYVRNLAKQLQSLGVADQAIQEIAHLVDHARKG